MRKNNLIEIRTNMGLFAFDVITVVGSYDDALKYTLKKFEIDEDFDNNFGFEPRGKCFYRIGCVPIVWIPKIPRTPREIATLSHEALHAVFHLHEWAGIPVTPETEEMTCHAMAHITNDVLEKLRKKRGTHHE